DPDELIRRRNPDDPIARMIVTKASIAPGDTTTSGWANQLAQNVVADFLKGLAPQSAAATLMPSGLQLTLDAAGINAISLPSRSGTPGAPTIVTELTPIPVNSMTATAFTLGPVDKFGTMMVASRSLVRASQGETVVITELRDRASAG